MEDLEGPEDIAVDLAAPDLVEVLTDPLWAEECITGLPWTVAGIWEAVGIVLPVAVAAAVCFP